MKSTDNLSLKFLKELTIKRHPMDESNKISNTKNVQNTKTYACANVNWIQKSFYDSKV